MIINVFAEIHQIVILEEFIYRNIHFNRSTPTLLSLISWTSSLSSLSSLSCPSFSYLFSSPSYYHRRRRKIRQLEPLRPSPSSSLSFLISQLSLPSWLKRQLELLRRRWWLLYLRHRRAASMPLESCRQLGHTYPVCLIA